MPKNKTNDSSIFEIDKNGTLIKIKKPGWNLQHFEIPEGVYSIINWYLLWDNNNLRSLTLPSTLRELELFYLPKTVKTVINHSPILFGWWVENHKYDGKTLSEMETIDLDKYTNSDGKPFTILATDSLKCCFNLKNLLFGTKFKRINTESVYGWNGVIKNIQITNKEILLDPNAFNDIPKSVNFYVCNKQIKEKLQKVGVNAKQIFIKPIPKEELEEPKEHKIELTC